jgi:hypothetical protein
MAGPTLCFVCHRSLPERIAPWNGTMAHKSAGLSPESPSCWCGTSQSRTNRSGHRQELVQSTAMCGRRKAKIGARRLMAGRQGLKQFLLAEIESLEDAAEPDKALLKRKQHQRKPLEYTRALPDRSLGRKHDSCSDFFATQPFDKIFATLSNGTTYP